MVLEGKSQAIFWLRGETLHSNSKRESSILYLDATTYHEYDQEPKFNGAYRGDGRRTFRRPCLLNAVLYLRFRVGDKERARHRIEQCPQDAKNFPEVPSNMMKIVLVR